MEMTICVLSVRRSDTYVIFNAWRWQFMYCQCTEVAVYVLSKSMHESGSLNIVSAQKWQLMYFCQCMEVMDLGIVGSWK